MSTSHIVKQTNIFNLLTYVVEGSPQGNYSFGSCIKGYTLRIAVLTDRMTTNTNSLYFRIITPLAWTSCLRVGGHAPVIQSSRADRLEL